MEYQPEECDPEHSPRRIVLIVAKILITFLPKQSHGIWTRSVRNFLKDFLDSLLSNAHTNWSNVLLPFSDIGSRTSTFDPCCRNVGLVAPSLIRSCVNLSVKHAEKKFKTTNRAMRLGHGDRGSPLHSRFCWGGVGCISKDFPFQ